MEHFADWQATNKHSLGGNLAQLHVVSEKKLIRGKKLHPRSERSAEELMEDLTHWERHVDPKKLEFLESYGISERTSLTMFSLKIGTRIEPLAPLIKLECLKGWNLGVQ